MLFEAIKMIHINCLGEMISVAPGKDQLVVHQPFPELDKAFDLTERYNRLMEELTSFYEESDYIYFE